MTTPGLEERLRAARERLAAARLLEAHDLADRAIAEARAAGVLGVLTALTARELGLAGATAELERALEVYPEDTPAADRIDGWVAVAEDADLGRRWREADRAWSRAIEAATETPERLAGLALSRGAGLLRHGRTEDALPHLQAATGAEDSAIALAACLLVSGLCLAAGDLDGSQEQASRAQNLAASRHNWLAHAAATVDLSEVLVRTEGLEPALGVVEEALALCRQRGDPGALLLARVHELRATNVPR